MPTKFCPKCKCTLPIGHFCNDKNRKDRLNSICKKCATLSRRIRSNNNKTKNKDIDYNFEITIYCCSCKKTKSSLFFNKNRGSLSGYSLRCKSCDSIANRKTAYGLEIDDVADILKKQGYSCALCKNPIGLNFHIDHCHRSGIVRGILCRLCNISLGMFRDDPVFLRAAASYLEQVPPSQQGSIL